MHLHKNVKVLGKKDGWTRGEWLVLPKEPLVKVGFRREVEVIPGVSARVCRGCSRMESPAWDAERGSTLDLSGNFVVWSWVRKCHGFRV